MIVCLTRNAEETRALGEKLSQSLNPGDVVCLTGPLGSGKTCLIQGIIRGQGVSDQVGSPSFVLMTEYSGKFPVWHVDLYRLTSSSELDGLGLEEFCDGEGISLVEWGEKAEEKLAYSCYLFLERGQQDECRISVQFENPDRERALSERLNDPGP